MLRSVVFPIGDCQIAMRYVIVCVIRRVIVVADNQAKDVDAPGQLSTQLGSRDW